MSKFISAVEATRKTAALLKDRRGVAAVQFALTLPILLLITLGIIDLALTMYDFHRASDATRRGARTAVILPPVADVTKLVAGTIVTCTEGGGGVVCVNGTVANPTSFDGIVADMQVVMKEIAAQDIAVEYTYSAPQGSNSTLLPLVRVYVKANTKTHTFMLLGKLPGLPTGFYYPSFSTTQMGAGYPPSS